MELQKVFCKKLISRLYLAGASDEMETPAPGDLHSAVFTYQFKQSEEAVWVWGCFLGQVYFRVQNIHCKHMCSQEM